jgi:hypothetical protein
MNTKQVSVFLENKPGRLADVAHILKEKGINLRVAVLSETSDFGILRLIVSNPDEAYLVLKENNFTVRTSDIVAVEVSDKPGILFNVTKLLEENQLSIEYMYSFVEQSSNQAVLFFGVEDVEKTLSVLKSSGYKTLTKEEMQKL